MKIYVGNLPYSINETDLSDLFGEHGAVEEAIIIMDRETGRSRGFGFVTMTDSGAGEQAIKALNDTDFKGRNLKVNEARPRAERARRY